MSTTSKPTDTAVITVAKTPGGTKQTLIIEIPKQLTDKNLMEALVMRLLALIPAPRKKQFRYLGVFAANAKWRREVVLRPKPPKRKNELANGEPECEHAARDAKPDETQLGHALSRLSWSQAMRRTFKLDVLQCVCGGRREVIALIPSGEIATKILAHWQVFRRRILGAANAKRLGRRGSWTKIRNRRERRGRPAVL